MGVNELIKNFEHVREYMREFYVYGFKSRNDFTKKSSRTYDEEKRRIASWLSEYISFSRTKDGKKVYIPIDSRVTHRNPLYRALKTKAFTNGEIILHFVLLDMFLDGEKHSLSDSRNFVDNYMKSFDEPKIYADDTVRNKLNEYVKEGILQKEKSGKICLYSLIEKDFDLDRDAVHFFSEVAPCGVIGSYVLDRFELNDALNADVSNEASENIRNTGDIVGFKHHYITSAMDSEILYKILTAIHEKRVVKLKNYSSRDKRNLNSKVVPLCVFSSVQNGRQYLIGYEEEIEQIKPYRLDYIVSVNVGDVCNGFDKLRNKLDDMIPHMWGVTTQKLENGELEHVEFTIEYGKNEQYIVDRLEREKRCGTVAKKENGLCVFSADVYDSLELIPWIRTFICRIKEIHFSNKEVEKQFNEDIEAMYKKYDV